MIYCKRLAERAKQNIQIGSSAWKFLLYFRYGGVARYVNHDTYVHWLGIEKSKFRSFNGKRSRFDKHPNIKLSIMEPDTETRNRN